MRKTAHRTTSPTGKRTQAKQKTGGVSRSRGAAIGSSESERRFQEAMRKLPNDPRAAHLAGMCVAL